MANFVRILVVAAGISHAAVASASLGGDASSIDADRIQMNVAHAARMSHSAGAYSVHETTLPNGTLIRQYASAAGVVFAVTWSGPFKPDLRQLLGTYFDTMISRQSGQVNAGHRFLSQHESDLVIESGGHQRNFSGRAYLPGSIPAGVVEADIR